MILASVTRLDLPSPAKLETLQIEGKAEGNFRFQVIKSWNKLFQMVTIAEIFLL